MTNAVTIYSDIKILPACAGMGLRAPHYRDVWEQRPAVGWLEVHPENYFAAGGKPLRWLENIRGSYPLSLHGVGLSLGSTDPLNSTHLHKLKSLIQRFEPAVVSEHICWGSHGGVYANDLLPLPYTEEALIHLTNRIQQVQDFLQCTILIENVSSYLQYAASTIPEWEFVVELARRSGCRLLVDVNNIYVNACNHRFNALDYLDAIPADLVGEIHLAGFTVKSIADTDVLIDTHSRPVGTAVWQLYHQAIQRFGLVPTLIEWDADIPPLAELVTEVNKAQRILDMEAAHVCVA